MIYEFYNYVKQKFHVQNAWIDDTHSSHFGSNEENNAIIKVSKKSLELRSEPKKYHLDSLYMKKKKAVSG